MWLEDALWKLLWPMGSESVVLFVKADILRDSKCGRTILVTLGEAEGGTGVPLGVCVDAVGVGILPFPWSVKGPSFCDC